MTEYAYMVRYTTWIEADFGPQPIHTYAGPFATREAAEFWIENNPNEYDTNLRGYPDPAVEKHPVRGVDDLK